MTAIIKQWLLSHFGPKIIFPCPKAKVTYLYILKLEAVERRASKLLDAIRNGYDCEEKDAMEALKSSVKEVGNFRERDSTSL